jgi:PAS domain S-box-containing protein
MEKSNEIKHLEALIDGQSQILELITQDKPLAEILEAITHWVEKQADHQLLASILFVDKEGRHLLHGAAPSLPPAYNKAIHGIEIGPSVGSCGTAAFTRKQVIVDDIEHDPLWANFKDLAMSFGLRACWSSPLISKQGNVLGTFAIYYKEPRKPTEDDLRLIQLVNRTTVLALEHKLAEEARQDIEISFQYMAESIPAMVWVSDADGRMTYMNKRWENYTGQSADIIKQQGWDGVLHPDDLQEALYKLQERAAKGENYEIYSRIKDSKGHYRWHLVLAYPRKNTAGEVVQWFGSSVDIHDQKSMVEELEQANEHSSRLADELQDALGQMEDEQKLLHDLLMNAPALICILRGPDHKFELVNPHYQELFPGRALKGKTVFEALPETKEQGFIDLLDNVYKTGQPYLGKGINLKIEDPDGSRREVVVDFVYQPLYKRGVVDGISVFAQDVSRQLNTYVSLNESTVGLS